MWKIRRKKDSKNNCYYSLVSATGQITTTFQLPLIQYIKGILTQQMHILHPKEFEQTLEGAKRP